MKEFLEEYEDFDPGMTTRYNETSSDSSSSGSDSSSDSSGDEDDNPNQTKRPPAATNGPTNSNKVKL